MWTVENRRRYDRSPLRYPSDLTDAEWAYVAPLITLFGMYPFLQTLIADAAYQGPKFRRTLAHILPYLRVDIVKRSDQVNGFAVLPKRRCRRLAKDWECLNRKGRAFLYLASIRLMLRKLCNP